MFCVVLLIICILWLFKIILIYSNTYKLAVYTDQIDLRKLIIILISSDQNSNIRAYNAAYNKIINQIVENNQYFSSNTGESEDRKSKDRRILNLGTETIYNIYEIWKSASKASGNTNLISDVSLVAFIYGEYRISDESYNMIWRILNLMTKERNNRWLNNYWEIALHYLSPIKNLPKEDVQRFKEFHIFLCSLYYVSDNKEALAYALTYRTSYPSKSELIPYDLNSIVDMIYNSLYNVNYNQQLSRYWMYCLPIDARFDFRISGALEDFMTLAIFLLPLNKLDTYSLNPNELYLKNEEKHQIIRIKDILKNLKWLIDKNLNKFDYYIPRFYTKEMLYDQAIKLLNQSIDHCDEELKNIEYNDAIDANKVQNIIKRINELFDKSFIDHLIAVLKKKGNQKFKNDFFLKHELPIEAKFPVPPELIMSRQSISHVNFEEGIISILEDQFINQFSTSITDNYTFDAYTIQYDDVETALDKLKLSNNYFILDFGNILRYKFSNGSSRFRYENSKFKYNGAEIIKLGNLTESFIIIIPTISAPKYDFVSNNNEILNFMPPTIDDLTITVYLKLIEYIPKNIKLTKLNITYDNSLGRLDLNKIKPLQ